MFAIRKSPFGCKYYSFDRPQRFLEILFLDHVTLYNGTHIQKYAHIEWTEKHRKTIVWKNTRA